MAKQFVEERGCPSYCPWSTLDGEVRGYLRNEQVQAYYSVVLVVGFVIGVGSLVLGFADMIR